MKIGLVVYLQRARPPLQLLTEECIRRGSRKEQANIGMAKVPDSG